MDELYHVFLDDHIITEGKKPFGWGWCAIGIGLALLMGYLVSAFWL